MRVFGTIALLVSVLLSPGVFAQPSGDLESIPKIELGRYLGLWYEVAKYPNRFQKDCVSDTSAEYRLMTDGRLEVLNRCRLSNGEMNQARGVAMQTGGASSAKLLVRFAPAWLAFLPFVWGDYWVIDLDDDYALAAVSEPKREYLWILSRSPVVEESRYSALIDRLARMGFDPGKLEKTVQHTP